MHVYEVCPRKDKRGFDLISDQLPFGRAVVRHAGSCNRLRDAPQSITSCGKYNRKIRKFCD